MEKYHNINVSIYSFLLKYKVTDVKKTSAEMVRIDIIDDNGQPDYVNIRPSDFSFGEQPENFMLEVLKDTYKEIVTDNFVKRVMKISNEFNRLREKTIDIFGYKIPCNLDWDNGELLLVLNSSHPYLKDELINICYKLKDSHFEVPVNVRTETQSPSVNTEKPNSITAKDFIELAKKMRNEVKKNKLEELTNK